MHIATITRTQRYITCSHARAHTGITVRVRKMNFRIHEAEYFGDSPYHLVLVTFTYIQHTPLKLPHPWQLAGARRFLTLGAWCAARTHPDMYSKLVHDAHTHTQPPPHTHSYTAPTPHTHPLYFDERTKHWSEVPDTVTVQWWTLHCHSHPSSRGLMTMVH